MEYEPELPSMTVKELEENNPLAYKIVLEIVRRSALYLYHSNPATNRLGLEKCIESLLDLIDCGMAKILYDEEAEVTWLGFFNSSTGEYQPPFQQECEDWSSNEPFGN